ncbi:MAG TPA: hypothetical protein VHY91_24630 [Pirellulales bacterium]|jgi:hypothetical protein|nr:hypothetical protein [Pirellulales bacterium]
MRAFRLGLLLLFALVSGCAAPESESVGKFDGYNGFPWPSLLKKNAAQNPDEAYAHPQFNGSGRFAPQSTTPIGTITPNEEAAPDQAPAAHAPAAEAAASE